MSRLVAYSVVVVVVVCCLSMSASQDHCDPRTGPAGLTICYYDETTERLGWFSCNSNSYIMATSGGKQQCVNGYNYCIYGCVEEGVLTDNCECSAPTTFMAVGSTISAWCYDPPGPSAEPHLQCIWYRECLDRKRPCEDAANGYAIAYGERFCNLYTDNVEASHFSQRAVDWIDAVRKCLQVALVPLLRPWHSPTCQQIKDIAFASHTGCYLDPAPGKPGICSLSFRDWLAVFWTIKGSFTVSPGATLRGVVDTALKCSWKPQLGIIPFLWLRLQLRILSSARDKRATTSDIDTDALSHDIAAEIAQRHLWDSRTLDWFGYSPHSPDSQFTTDSTILTDILITDKLSLGLTRAPDAPIINLNDTITELIGSIQNGTIRELRLTTFNLTVLSIEKCDILNCGSEQPGLDGTDSPNNGLHPLPAILSVAAMLFIGSILRLLCGHD